VVLEKAVFQQERSRYELQGQYTLPPPLQLRPPPHDDAPSAAAASTATKPAAAVAAEAEAEEGDALQPELCSHPVAEVKRVPWTPGGRWRWRMEVPGAEVVEMLPAVRLVSAISGKKLQVKCKTHVCTSEA
jgi:hypothetical protein